MARYRTMPVEIDAVRWDGNKFSENPDWLMRRIMSGFTAAPGYIWRERNVMMVVLTTGERVAAAPGDYIIQRGDDLLVSADDDFAAYYEPLDPPEAS